MTREIMKVTREDDDQFGIYLDGELWKKKDIVVTFGVLYELGLALCELIDRRTSAEKCPDA